MFRKRTSKHLRTGKRGEDLAAWYLRLSGYRIVMRNFRCRFGEIDIIARKDDHLIFIEVRTRAAGALAHPFESVDTVKVFRTVQAARMYLVSLRPHLPFCRFDVIGITAYKYFPFWRIRHLRNAFDITSGEFREGCRRETGRSKRRFEKRGEWKIENGEWRFRRGKR